MSFPSGSCDVCGKEGKTSLAYPRGGWIEEAFAEVCSGECAQRAWDRLKRKPKKCSATNCPNPAQVDDMFGFPWCSHHYFCPLPEPETNSAVDKKERRKELRCSFCPPNRKENANRKPKHGVKKKR